MGAGLHTIATKGAAALTEIDFWKTALAALENGFGTGCDARIAAFACINKAKLIRRPGWPNNLTRAPKIASKQLYPVD